MIQIKEVKMPTVKLYSPDKKFLGEITEYQLLDIRVQIKKEKVFGYYIEFNNRNIRLDKYGELEEYPDGLLDTFSNYMLQLL